MNTLEVVVQGGRKGWGQEGYSPAKHNYCGEAKPLSFFVEGHPEHQAATLVLIIASLYIYNWMQQNVIKAVKRSILENSNSVGNAPRLPKFAF